MSSRKLDFKKIINRLVLFIGLGVAAHIVFVLSTTEKSLLNYLTNLSFGHLALISVLMFVPWAAYALRILIWANFFKEKIRYSDALRVVITSDLASALTPTAVGGAPAKAALLLNRGFATPTVGFILTYGVVEDIVFYTTGILMAAIFSTGLLAGIGSSILGFIQINIVSIMWITGVLGIYLAMIKMDLVPKMFKINTYLPQKWKDYIQKIRMKLGQSIDGMKSNFASVWADGKLSMAASLTLLFIQWFSKFSVLLVILDAFHVDFDTIQLYIRQWVVFVTMLFIPTPGASGGAEASFLVIFGKSIPKELSFLIVSVWRLFTYYFLLLSAVVFYIIISFTMRNQEEVVIEEVSEP